VNLPPIILDWFAERGWQPRRHQLEMLDAAGAGRHALLVAATGAGKTLAGFLPTLCELISETRAPAKAGVQTQLKNAQTQSKNASEAGSRPAPGHT
jgi:Lhr-like helicase